MIVDKGQLEHKSALHGIRRDGSGQCIGTEVMLVSQRDRTRDATTTFDALHREKGR